MFEIMLAAALAAAPATPATPETPRPRDPQNYEPWLADQELRPGDRWYRMVIDIDRHGRATRCRIRASNDRSRDRRFWTCRAFLNGAFETAPIMRDGVAVAGTIERTVVMPGRNSVDIYERERRNRRRSQRNR